MPSRMGSQGAERHLHAVPDGGGDFAGEPAEPSPLAELADLAGRRSSGELVCSCSGGEIHVYLQEGRIAWAVSTTQRRAFSEHLKATAGVEHDVIETIVAECSRTHRPLGEALIAWKVATAEQVRASLLHQIRTSLQAAARATDARTLFLERAHYCRYDRTLTFPLTEVISGARSAPAVAPPPAPAAAPALDVALTRVADAPPSTGLGPVAELATTKGFAAAAVLSTLGELLAVVGDGARVGKVVGLTHHLLQLGQRLAIELRAGRCHQLHLETDDAHLLIYSARSGPVEPSMEPGALHRFVLVLRDLSQLALAKRRAGAVAAVLEAGRTGGAP